MRSPHYKATDCILYVDTEVHVHVWKICKRRLSKHSGLVTISLSASLSISSHIPNPGLLVFIVFIVSIVSMQSLTFVFPLQHYALQEHQMPSLRQL